MADYQINISAKDDVSPKLGKIETGLAGVTAGATKFKTALGIAGAALAGLGIASKIQDQIDDFDNLAKSARAAGAAASGDAFKGFQVLKQAMGEAGIDAATFDRAMLQTTSRLKEGMEGGEAFSEIFNKLGDSVKDANGNLAAGPDLLKAMINGLNEGTISTDEFAKVVGGRAGPLIQQQFASLQDGAEGLAATLADVEANSNIVSLESAQQAEKFNDTVGRLKNAFGQLMTDALEPLMPILVDLAERILANMPAIIEKVKVGFDALSPVFSLLGTILTDVVGPVLGLIFDVLGNIAGAIAPLVETAIPALGSAFDGIVGIVQSVYDWFMKVIQGMTDIYNKAVEMKNGVVDSISGMADGIEDNMKGAYNSIVNWFSDAEDEAVGNSIVPDMVDAILAEFRRQTQGIEDQMSQTHRVVTEGFYDMSDVSEDFASTLTNALSDGKLELRDFEGFFKSTLTNLLNSALDAGGGIGGIFSKITGGLGGLFGGGGGGFDLGGIFSGIGSFFGGFFADGGYLPSGQWGIAGEAGPEVITGPARVHPMEPGNSAPVNVSFTINTIDSRGMSEALIKERKTIEGIIQSAYNKRGKQGIV